MVKMSYYGPKADKPAEWMFYPNAKTRKRHPDASGDDIGMDLQDDEIICLLPKSVETLKGNLVLEIAEGRVELLQFDRNWRSLDRATDDAIVWDVARIIEAWASDD